MLEIKTKEYCQVQGVPYLPRFVIINSSPPCFLKAENDFLLSGSIDRGLSRHHPVNPLSSQAYFRAAARVYVDFRREVFCFPHLLLVLFGSLLVSYFYLICFCFS